MKRVQGKVAVVTGAAHGIGRAISLLLAEEGAAVVVTDILADEGEAVTDEIRRAGGNARFFRVDVSKEGEVAGVFAAVADAFGRLDILVNNAGIGGTYGRSDETSESDWDAVMAVNVKGAFFCTKHAAPLMRSSGGGSIVNISSIYGIVGSANVAPYHASKGALRIMSKTDALAYAEDRIRVNSIHPGFIWTRMLMDGNDAAGVGPEMARNAMEKLHPLGVLGEPEDVAYGVLYLASDESKFVTGSELVIDGGYTAR